MKLSLQYKKKHFHLPLHSSACTPTKDVSNTTRLIHLKSIFYYCFFTFSARMLLFGVEMFFWFRFACVVASCNVRSLRSMCVSHNSKQSIDWTELLNGNTEPHGIWQVNVAKWKETIICGRFNWNVTEFHYIRLRKKAYSNAINTKCRFTLGKILI